MQQILFHIPFVNVPIAGFGAMLFVAFMFVTAWGARRAVKVGMPWDKFQDMAIVLFITGFAGARVVYMIQYSEQFPDKSPGGLLLEFVQIWNGGIVVYGAVFGGLLGYIVYRRIILKKFGVNGWKLADAVAPLMAMGMAVGRIGCFLNGCCWGQVACEECQPVPLAAELGQFPLLPAHARTQCVMPAKSTARLPQIHGLQTSTGFSIESRDPFGVADPRAVVAAVEPKSAAAASGLQPGDRVVQVNGKPNAVVLELTGPPEMLAQAEKILADGSVMTRSETNDGDKILQYAFESPAAAVLAQAKLAPLRGNGLTSMTHDSLWELVRDWPRGEAKLALVVDRKGVEVPIAFTPQTVTFFPTQIYETVSMTLLMLLLLAFQPFRRHDGQVMVVMMLGYAAHRFLNEAIRIEPTYAMGLTLSQWISVGIFLAGLLMEVYLRWANPKLPAGEVPLGYGAIVAKV